jgi:hypothetical protein
VLRSSFRWIARTACALVLSGVLAQAASACPMCNQSIAEEDKLPKAYMVSILFMLGMPATIFTTAGILIHFKIRKYNAEQAALLAGDATFPTPVDHPAAPAPVV